MKKALITIAVFVFLAITFTYTMIKIKKQSIIDQRPLQNAKASNDIIVEENENDFERIVIGETKYYENPIDIKWVNMDGIEVDRLTYGMSGYIKIAGLKDKSVEDKINNRMREIALKKVEERKDKNNYFYLTNYNIKANFANVISIEDNSNQDCFIYNFNLVDGEIIKFQDYVRDKNSVKNALAKQIAIELSNKYEIGKLLDKDGNFLKEYFNEATLEYETYTQEDIEQIYTAIENDQLKLMRLFDNNEFEFWFDNKALFIGFGAPYLITCRIPLYDIYYDVSIFTRFSNKDIYEKSITEEKYIGIDSFSKINEDFWYSEVAFEPVDIDKENLNENDLKIYNREEENKDRIFKKLEQENDKKIIHIVGYLYSMQSGYYSMNFTLKYNKNASLQETKELFYLMMSYNDVDWPSQTIGKLEDLSKTLKRRYQDIDYTIEVGNEYF